MMTPELFIQATVAMIVITSPFDPIKILFFGQAIETSGEERRKAAVRTAIYVLVILVGSALVGKPVLSILGIDLDAFRVVGGLVIAIMGFEMLYGGGASSTQGEKHRKDGPDQDDQLMVPLTLPLIAGPGAITTAITHAAQDGGTIPTLAACGTVALITFASFVFIGKSVESVKPATISLMARIGGLLLATIGAQMLLGGLKNFMGL
jgi:multiple antibiotic resistance protein